MDILVKTFAIVKEPEFKFDKPVFKKKVKIGLPKASSNQDAKKYLEDRNIDPDKFYYAERFKEWTNTKVHTFDDLTYDEPRIIIPLIYKDEVCWLSGKISRSQQG